MTRRVTMITIEKERSIEIISRHLRVKGWCRQCNRPVVMLAPEKAAVIAGVGPRLIYRWVEAGQLHFLETDRGLVRICLDSLIPVAEDFHAAGSPGEGGRDQQDRLDREQGVQNSRKEIGQ